jgi:hypothetical protein
VSRTGSCGASILTVLGWRPSWVSVGLAVAWRRGYGSFTLGTFNLGELLFNAACEPRASLVHSASYCRPAVRMLASEPATTAGKPTHHEGHNLRLEY